MEPAKTHPESIIDETSTHYSVRNEATSSISYIRKDLCQSRLVEEWKSKQLAKRRLSQLAELPTEKDDGSMDISGDAKRLRSDVENEAELKESVFEKLFGFPVKTPNILLPTNKESVHDILVPMTSLQKKMMHRLVQYFAFCIDYFCTGPSDDRVLERILPFLKYAHDIAHHPVLYEQDRLQSTSESRELSRQFESSYKFEFLQVLLNNLEIYGKRLLIVVYNETVVQLLVTYLQQNAIEAEIWKPETANSTPSLTQAPTVYICTPSDLEKHSMPNVDGIILFDMISFYTANLSWNTRNIPVVRLIQENSIEHVLKFFDNVADPTHFINCVGITASLNSSPEEMSAAHTEQASNVNFYKQSTARSISDAEKVTEDAYKLATYFRNPKITTWPLDSIPDLRALTIATASSNVAMETPINSSSTLEERLRSGGGTITNDYPSVMRISSTEEQRESAGDNVEFDALSTDFENNLTVSYLQKRLQMIQSELREVTLVKNDKQAELESMEQQLSKQIDLMQEYREQMRLLKIENAELKKKEETTRQKNTELSDKNVELEKNVSTLDQQLQIGFRWLQDVPLSDAQQELKQAREHNVKLEHLLKTQREDLNFITEQYQTASTSASEERQEINTLQRECDKLRQQNTEGFKLIQDYRDTQIESLLKRINELEIVNAMLRQQQKHYTKPTATQELQDTSMNDTSTDNDEEMKDAEAAAALLMKH
ncbi:telomere maintenance protein Ccq1 [Schizosaccharomyces japonicus yFS275]|uniref:Telomere maintenance protein Ccq1 n=1 Tax=Schizosaccharomyces japonicus (strain yFS275 / FY16936) TaxID=402676 RepID=B6K4X1_SCHJY|nr:telomere maintenance protein Ccq1 [Schizosaccharomyces japonicus yFS275]EEB08528.1 telomere maintenance protein Ccq1 [Schizosaccharomyces japonicus yFS275]